MRIKPYHLKVYITNQYAYAQVIRMLDGHVMAAASTKEKALREGLQSATDVTACAKVRSAVLSSKCPCSASGHGGIPLKPRPVHWPARATLAELRSAPRGQVGEALAERVKTRGVDGVHWKRNPGQKFHGRIAAVITAIREHGVPTV